MPIDKKTVLSSNDSNIQDPLSKNRLRPLRFFDFVGQSKNLEPLQIMVKAARARQEPLHHILLSGPPGLGKTTLAHIIGNEMEVRVHVTSGPVIEKAGDLAGMLTNLTEGDILFIDEIHRLPKSVEEYLFPAMEDFRIDLIVDQGPNARSVSLDLQPFTLIGATTRSGLLSEPLLSRFTLQIRLDYYRKTELKSIVLRSAKLLNVAMDDGGALEIASRSRGTPRTAIRWIKFVRDFAQQKKEAVISQAVAREALALLDIDENGLNKIDKRLLYLLGHHFQGKPTGLNTLAIALGEEPDTLSEEHEPFLIQEGFLIRTPRGRQLTERGWSVLQSYTDASWFDW